MAGLAGIMGGVGRTSVYLVPEASDVSPEEYAERVRSFLLATKVVAPFEDNDPSFLAFGDESTLPFEVPPEHLAAGERVFGFEFCTIYAGKLTLVPDEGVVEPKCPRCGADVTGPYYDAIGGEEGQGVDYAAVRVKCPGCGGSFRPDALNDSVGIFLVDRYVNFDDAFTKFRPEWLAELERQTGSRHRVLAYWYT